MGFSNTVKTSSQGAEAPATDKKALLGA